MEQLFITTAQQYSFNFPYQCGTGADPPDMADDNEHTIQDRDIVLLASDGVFDNMFEADLLKCINHYFNKNTLKLDLEQTANCIGY